ncbi:beta-lactamase family protein [Shimazuella sp. AN120528]|uniref:serine hydrolase domain-containing protein n=1 Tax=Shimazuella soli TaxID=1892854 RepID=UPI001F118660|nr:beta-lactamase family protein [Shimazuella soli]MCH5585533.1 beta-lactamase family protein [Shimazuella soli]
MEINRKIKAFMEECIKESKETGLQAAAYVDGQLVLDTWAGIANPSTGQEVTRDTLFTVFSCGKGIVATAIHLLAEAGKIDYDDPIST